MTNEKLYEALGDINEKHINEARAYHKAKKHGWVKWGAMAACLCLVVCVGSYIAYNFIPDGGGFGNGDATLFAEHREDFSSEISSDILAQLGLV